MTRAKQLFAVECYHLIQRRGTFFDARCDTCSTPWDDPSGGGCANSHADQGLLVTPGPDAQQVIKTRLVIVLSLSFLLFGPQCVSLLHHGYHKRAVTLHHDHSNL